MSSVFTILVGGQAATDLASLMSELDVEENADIPRSENIIGLSASVFIRLEFKYKAY